MTGLKKLKYLLDPKDTLLFLQMVTLLCCIPVLLYLFPIHQLLQFFTPQRTSKNKHSEQKIIKFSSYILRKKIFWFGKNCLKRSLLLYYFLRKNGYPVLINFGIRKKEGKLTGHGWLTKDGNFYAEEVAQREKFTTIYSFPLRQHN